jgi:hypothetical protein
MNEVTMVQKNTQCNYSAFSQVRICCLYLYSIVNKCTTSKKGELSATSHDDNEYTLQQIMRDKRNTFQHPAVEDSTLLTTTELFRKYENGKQFKLLTVRNKPCEKCYFDTAMEHQDAKAGSASYDATVTPSIADNTINPNSITFLIRSLANDDPTTIRQFITARTTMLIYRPRQLVNGEHTTVATRADTGLIVSTAVRLTNDAPTTIVDLADDDNPANAHATNHAIIDLAVNIHYVAACIDAPGKIEDAITKNAKPFLASLTSKLRYAASAVAQVNAADNESPLIMGMITTLADGFRLHQHAAALYP